MLKLCSYCRIEKDADECFPDNDWPKCWDCAYDYYVETTPIKYHSGIRTKENYITEAKKRIARERLEKIQHNRCAICDAHAADNHKELSLDHDHETGEIRGLLCNNCNTVLGMADDNPHLLRAAADYLEKYSHSENEQALPASPLPSS